jgi:hypothetical protein
MSPITPSVLRLATVLAWIMAGCRPPVSAHQEVASVWSAAPEVAAARHLRHELSGKDVRVSVFRHASAAGDHVVDTLRLDSLALRGVLDVLEARAGDPREFMDCTYSFRQKGCVLRDADLVVGFSTLEATVADTTIGVRTWSGGRAGSTPHRREWRLILTYSGSGWRVASVRSFGET